MADPNHDWFLKQWLASLRTRQAAIIKQTGYSKSKLSKLVNGGQPYDRQCVNDIARALHIAPFELLMHPDDAMALRRLRESAVQIAADRAHAYIAEDTSDTRRAGTG